MVPVAPGRVATGRVQGCSRLVSRCGSPALPERQAWTVGTDHPLGRSSRCRSHPDPGDIVTGTMSAWHPTDPALRVARHGRVQATGPAPSRDGFPFSVIRALEGFSILVVHKPVSVSRVVTGGGGFRPNGSGEGERPHQLASWRCLKPDQRTNVSQPGCSNTIDHREDDYCTGRLQEARVSEEHATDKRNRHELIKRRGSCKTRGPSGFRAPGREIFREGSRTRGPPWGMQGLPHLQHTDRKAGSPMPLLQSVS